MVICDKHQPWSKIPPADRIQNRLSFNNVRVCVVHKLCVYVHRCYMDSFLMFRVYWPHCDSKLVLRVLSNLSAHSTNKYLFWQTLTMTLKWPLLYNGQKPTRCPLTVLPEAQHLQGFLEACATNRRRFRNMVVFEIHEIGFDDNTNKTRHITSLHVGRNSESHKSGSLLAKVVSGVGSSPYSTGRGSEPS